MRRRTKRDRELDIHSKHFDAEAYEQHIREIESPEVRTRYLRAGSPFMKECGAYWDENGKLQMPHPPPSLQD